MHATSRFPCCRRTAFAVGDVRCLYNLYGTCKNNNKKGRPTRFSICSFCFGSDTTFVLFYACRCLTLATTPSPHFPFGGNMDNLLGQETAFTRNCEAVFWIGLYGFCPLCFSRSRRPNLRCHVAAKMQTVSFLHAAMWILACSLSSSSV